MTDAMLPWPLPDEAATRALGAALAATIPLAAPNGFVVALSGELGAGKTTLVRAWLRALGHDGPVRSPTYTLVEPYEVGASTVHHFDLYRLADEDELDAMGFRDYLSGGLALVEWPERGGVLARAQLRVRLHHVDAEARHAELEGAPVLLDALSALSAERARCVD